MDANDDKKTQAMIKAFLLTHSGIEDDGVSLAPRVTKLSQAENGIFMKKLLEKYGTVASFEEQVQATPQIPGSNGGFGFVPSSFKAMARFANSKEADHAVTAIRKLDIPELGGKKSFD